MNKQAYIDGYRQKAAEENQSEREKDFQRLKEQGRDSWLGNFKMDMPYRDLNDPSVGYEELNKGTTPATVETARQNQLGKGVRFPYMKSTTDGGVLKPIAQLLDRMKVRSAE